MRRRRRRRSDLSSALVTLYIGSGMGTATIIERA
jgi:acetyl-CoA acetyltransferase